MHFKELFFPLAVDDDGIKTDGVTAYECPILFPQDQTVHLKTCIISTCSG